MTNIRKWRNKPILVVPQVTVEQKNAGVGIALEILLLFAGLLGYVFCNTTALDMGIPPVAVVLISALCFGLMILLVWYKRVFFGVLGGLAGLSLLLWPVSFPLYRMLWQSLVVCYNYTVYLLGSQEGYSSYMSYMTMDLSGYLENPSLLHRYFYTAVILLALIAALFFALALFRRIPILVAFLIPALGLVPLFFFGIVPHYAAFSVFLSALIGSYGQSIVQYLGHRRSRAAAGKGEKGGARRKKRASAGRRKSRTTAERFAFAANHGSFGVIVAGIMLVVTISTAAFIYTRPILEMDQFRASLDTLSQNVMNTLFRSAFEKNLNVAGYMEEGELLGLQVPSWRRLKVCTVSTRTDTPVYLRYRTTVDLIEDGWTVADEAFLEELSNVTDMDFCEYTQYYNYLVLTAPGGDPLTAGLDNIDSEEQGYITDQITVDPDYKVSDLLGLPGGATSITPLGDYEEYEREGDTVLRHNDDPDDRSYMFRVVSPVMTSNLYLEAFEATQESYLALRSTQGESDPYMSREMAYSSFVYRHYLTLPDTVRQSVFALASEITAPYESKLERVQAIERYFRDNYSYSLVRQRLTREDGTPADAYDYINYFLFQNENKEGYCTLFASSMVAMLRSLGYPARVATGYYATPYLVDTDQYAADLNDSNYHAWVEVYFEGAGWLSFEPTPGFGAERNYHLLEAVDQGIELETPSVTIEYEEIPGMVHYSKELPDPTIETEEEPLVNVIAGALQLNSRSGIIRLILRIVLVLLLVVAVLLGGRIAHRKNLGKVAKGPPEEGVRAGYYVILRLMQMQGFRFFEGELLEDFARRADNLKLAPEKLSLIVPTLQKALYSDQPVSEEERGAVLRYIQALDKASFRRVNPFKGYWYKLILGSKPRRKSMIWVFS